MSGIDVESLIKTAVGSDDAKVFVQNDEGLGHGLHDRPREHV